MRKKTDQLLSGKFIYKQPPLLFSQEKISVTLKSGETVRGELYVGTDDNRKIRGYVTSSSRRVVPGLETISGTTICLPYGVDGVGMNPGERLEGWLCFTTDIGEYKLPFEICTREESMTSSLGEVRSLDAFCDVAREDFREAYRLFVDRSFGTLLKGESRKLQSLYAGMSSQPVTYQHLEEFLIAAGKKEPVRLSLDSHSASFSDMKEAVQESLVLHRSGWGHLRAEVEVRGDFLEPGKHVLTNDDFIGSTCRLSYVIHGECLGRGRQYGEIRICTPYEELCFEVQASRARYEKAGNALREKKDQLAILRLFLAHAMNRMELSPWLTESLRITKSLGTLEPDYAGYRLYEAYLLHRQGNDLAAREILKGFKNRSFSREEAQEAGVYLYLRYRTGLYANRGEVLRAEQTFYAQRGDSLILLGILLELDPSIPASQRVFMLEELFDRGCTSPFLYLGAWKEISGDMTLLHRLNRFWAQVFLFAGRQEMLTGELVMRLSYLSGYEKTFSESLYQALVMGCEAFPTDDSVEAVCRYVMKGNPRKPEYFRWFSMAVERGLKLTRLYEYYVETMDITYQRALPRSVLMYFAYNNNNLGDSRKAHIYAGVIAGKESDPATYESYREAMEDFAAKKLREGRIGEDYAAIYQEFLSRPKDGDTARLLAGKMFTSRIYTDDPRARFVVVRHRQMKKEEICPFVQGVAYPRIYTEDGVILFQDEKQRRYASTVDYNRGKLLNEREMLPRVLELGADDPGVLLHFCENAEPEAENLHIFLRLLRSDAFTSEYKRQVRQRLLDFYAAHMHDEELTSRLREMNYRDYAAVDKKTLLEILIDRGMFSQALGIVEEFGFEGVGNRELLRLTSRMIVKSDFAEDEELLALASHVYRCGLFDEVILHYLMEFRSGPMEELLSIWKSAVGFEMDTYSLEERILSLLIFTSDDRREGEQILAAYIRHAGKERIIGAYLTQIAYGIFVKENPMTPFIRDCLENAYLHKWPVNRVCRLALFKDLSREKKPKGWMLDAQKEFLRECLEENMNFSFFRRLPTELLSPYQLDDKTFVEYHTSPRSRVTLVYTLDTGLGTEPQVHSEPLPNVYEGIFVKSFTLFYGETLRYYFVVEEDGSSARTSEHTLSMSHVEGSPASRYQLLNQILSARKLEKGPEVTARMKEYLRREQYVRKMFVIEKEG